MKNVSKEVEDIARAHKFVPKTKWTADHDDVLRKYAGKVSNKGLLEIMKKLFPKDYFTYASIAKKVSRRKRS
jgi:hypothetical protein